MLVTNSCPENSLEWGNRDEKLAASNERPRTRQTLEISLVGALLASRNAFATAASDASRASSDFGRGLNTIKSQSLFQQKLM
jgi:hypothetical protein